MVSLIRARVCEISLRLDISGLLSKNSFFVIWLQEIFSESFIEIYHSVSLFKTKLASRYSSLSTTSATIVSPSSIISLVLIVSLSEMSGWREFTCDMIVVLSC